MTQSESASSAGRPQPARKQAAAWLTNVTYVLFLVWMLYKQRLALQATGIKPGPQMLLATFGLLLVITPWFFLRSGRRQLLWMLVPDLFLTFLTYADILYFRQFSDLVSVASLRFAGQLATVHGAVAELVQRQDIWLFIDIPIIAILSCLPARWGTGLLRRLGTEASRLRVGIRTAIALAVTGAIIVTGTAYFDPILGEKYYGHSMVASRMGLLNYHLFDTGSYAERLVARSLPNSATVAEVQNWFNQRNAAAPQPGPLHGAYAGKNVIVVQVESLQAFPVGLTVNGQEVTPNLNRLMKESMFFDDFYTQTGQGVTSDADFLTNCSLYPARTGAVYYDDASNDFRCMPTLLREHGYHAYAMQGMPADFWNLQAVYPHVGFEHYYSLNDFKYDEKIGLGLSDESFLRQASERLTTLPQPFYSFLVTLTSHGPFDFPNLPQGLNLPPNLQSTVFGHYLEAVHYTDGAIGHLLDDLKQNGLLDKSIFVLYGDHAGVFRSGSGMEDLLHIPGNDEVALTRMEKRIPMFIRLPDGAHAGVNNQIMGQVDTAPSLASLLGVPTNNVYFMGRDVFSQKDGVIDFYTGSATTSDKLFSFIEGEPGNGRCYDRKSGSQIDVSQCQPMATQAAESLKISREIVDQNLIPSLMKNQQKH